MLLIVMYVLMFSDVVSVLAGGSYVRCFNVVSGSLLWELSVASAEPSHHASLQFIGTGENCRYLAMPNHNVISDILYINGKNWPVCNQV